MTTIQFADLFIIYYIIITALVAATRFSPLGTDNGKDAYRWLDFPGFQLQPSELCKLMIIFAVAVAINRLQNKLKTFYPFLAAGAITVIPLAFILLQPGFIVKALLLYLSLLL